MQGEIMDVLEILDMTEEEQCRYLAKLFQKRYFDTDKWPEWYGICDILIHNTFPGRKVILADLAFRLRNEAVKRDITKYIDAENIVKAYVLTKTRIAINWSYDSQPIHWIVASIKAKELAKK